MGLEFRGLGFRLLGMEEKMETTSYIIRNGENGNNFLGPEQNYHLGCRASSF